jgi:endoglucanase
MRVQVANRFSILVVGALMAGVAILGGGAARAEAEGLASESLAQACDATKDGTLSTRGRYIIDVCKNRVKLKAVNWYGASDEKRFPGGLDKQPIKHIIDKIVEFGANAVRLPFANAILTDANLNTTIDLTASNPGFKGSPWEIYKKVVKALTDRGLYVIVNNHTTRFAWCCGTNAWDPDGLWFHDEAIDGHTYTTDTWIAHWVTVASEFLKDEYKGFVVGADLRNEVRNGNLNGGLYSRVDPNWGKGDKYDWRAAATKAISAIQGIPAINGARRAGSDLLVIVEAINWRGTLCGYRPGLGEMLYNPVYAPKKLVYGIHHYPYTGPELLTDQYPLHCVVKPANKSYSGFSANKDNFFALLDREFGFMVKNGIAPVWVSEFGVENNFYELQGLLLEDRHAAHKRWLSLFVEYLKTNDLDWAYWPLNGTYAGGGDEAFGLLDTSYAAFRYKNGDNNWRWKLLQDLVGHKGLWGTVPEPTSNSVHIFRTAAFPKDKDGEILSIDVPDAWKNNKKGRAVCPQNYHVTGVSQGHVLLCAPNGTLQATPGIHQTLTDIDGSASYDWAPRYNKYTCPAKYHIIGLAQGSNGISEVLCRAHINEATGHDTVYFWDKDARPASTAYPSGDWHPSHVKGECPPTQFLAGVGIWWDARGRWTSTMRCGAQASP